MSSAVLLISLSATGASLAGVTDRGQGAGVGEAAVRNGVGRHRYRAVVVGCRGEGVRTVAVDNERAHAGDGCGLACGVDGGIACDLELRDAQAVAVDV